MVQETTVVPDNSKPWQIALQNPNTTELVFSGFSAVSAVPFDHMRPPATITAKAKVVNGEPRALSLTPRARVSGAADGDSRADNQGRQSYAKGHVPDGPIPAAHTNGSLFEVELVPLAHSNGLRLTVLPVLA